MRPWKITLTAAACALLIDLAVVRRMSSSSFAALLGITLFALLVLLITTTVAVVGLRKICKRLAEPPRSRKQWVTVFAGTGLERLGHRIIDLASSGPAHDTEALLLQSPIDPSKARREVAILYRDWLTRAQFFTGLALLLAISIWSIFEWYFAMLVPGGLFPVSLSLAAFLAVSVSGLLSHLAIGSTTEAILDHLTELPAERLDTRLLRSLTELAERTSTFQALAGSPLSPAIAKNLALDDFPAVLEAALNSLDASTKRLGTNADLLAGAVRALSDRESSGSALLVNQHAAEELRIAIKELIQAIARLPAIAETTPAQKEMMTEKHSAAERQLTTDTDFSRELRELLKEFE